MENMSAMDLNNKLLDLPVFFCKNCAKMLRKPIMNVPSVGNFCSTCILDLPNAVPNKDLEDILQELSIPCQFQSNGCKEKLDFSSVSKHEALCDFHDSVCPLEFYEKCNWNTPFLNIADHFEEHHQNFVKTSENNAVELTFHLDFNYVNIYLLVIKNEKFLVHVKVNVDQHKVYYTIYYLGDECKIENFNCTIEFQAKNFRIENKGNILSKKIVGCFEKNRATAFSISVLRELFEENVTSCIKIVSNKPENFELDEKSILDCFECPICENLMRPPIYQCLVGHSICDKCRSKLQQCPTCRANFGCTRNFVLESVANLVRYPCNYKTFGCAETFPASEIGYHELVCNLKPYSCPLYEYLHCQWDGSYSSIVAHLKFAHEEYMVYSDSRRTTNSFLFSQSHCKMFCMVTEGQIFRVCHQRHLIHQNGYWSVQLIGPKGEAQKYKFEVHLIDVKNENRTLIMTDTCQDVTGEENMFKKCVTLPLNLVDSYANSSELTYYYKIIRKVISE